MQYKTLDEQIKQAILILEKNAELMDILNYLYKLNLPNFYIAAGSIFQTIWNYYDNKPINNGIKDIDIIYYDSNNLSKEYEQDLQDRIKYHFDKLNINYKFDVDNEARMHLWKKENENKNIDQYKNSEDAISKWIATIHAIGLTRDKDGLKIYAPYGLSDIYSRTIRPIKHKDNSKELYNKKIESWSKRFDNLNIIKW
ncbi:MAG: nucleotidyltransferase family protein [Bacilli bacterium]|nr:nucleotidyltransferase family protein [Bacilli bacterium]